MGAICIGLSAGYLTSSLLYKTHIALSSGPPGCCQHTDSRYRDDPDYDRLCIPESQPQCQWQKEATQDQPIAETDIEQPMSFQLVAELIDESFKQDAFLFQQVFCHC